CLSFYYSPERVRHGHHFSKYTHCVCGNLKITAIVTVDLDVELGGDVVWSLVGLLVGKMQGAAVMTLHALHVPLM
ncbi:cytosine permease, partial [Klebsiella pneumoniae]|nr:cytosine permease [Klebsiella pneumoniae]